MEKLLNHLFDSGMIDNDKLENLFSQFWWKIYDLSEMEMLKSILEIKENPLDVLIDVLK
jgi:hypothetical protein